MQEKPGVRPLKVRDTRKKGRGKASSGGGYLGKEGKDILQVFGAGPSREKDIQRRR